MLPLDQIICCDCVDGMRELPDESIDLIVTSPPYDGLRTYNGYEFDFDAISAQIYRVMKQGGVVVWVVNDETIDGSESGTSFAQALHFKEIGFNLETMIWEKPGFSDVGSTRYRYAPVFEYMFVLSKGYPKTFNPIKDRKVIHAGEKKSGTLRLPDGSMRRLSNEGAIFPDYGIRFNVWHMNQSKPVDGHPAPFPERLAYDHIVTWSNTGDIVLDPFVGSGTTALAARTLGRHYIGFDISEEYVNLAKDRLDSRLI